jgi:hypothetical protein
MKTADLVRLLSEDVGPAPGRSFAPRLLAAAAVGAAISAGVLLLWLGFRPLSAAAATRPFWMKAGYTLALAACGFVAALRVGRPGGRVGVVLWLAVAAVAMLGMMAGQETLRAPPSQIPALWLGRTWAICPARILGLSAPVFALVLWAMRRMAPTRLRLAGAVAGLLAGGVGAAVYGLYCEETAAAFVVVWYTLGVAACGAVGALIGPRVLRW